MLSNLNEAKIYLKIDETDFSEDFNIQLMLDATEEQIKDFCHDTFATVPPGVKLAQLKWLQKEHTNQSQGSNGIQSENIAGQSTTYVQGIPEDIQDMLYKYKKVVVI